MSCLFCFECNHTLYKCTWILLCSSKGACWIEFLTIIHSSERETGEWMHNERRRSKMRTRCRLCLIKSKGRNADKIDTCIWCIPTPVFVSQAFIQRKRICKRQNIQQASSVALRFIETKGLGQIERCILSSFQDVLIKLDWWECKWTHMHGFASVGSVSVWLRSSQTMHGIRKRFKGSSHREGRRKEALQLHSNKCYNTTQLLLNSNLCQGS